MARSRSGLLAPWSALGSSNTSSTQQALSSSQATFKSTLADVQSSLAGSSSTYHKDLKKQTESLDIACSDSKWPHGLKRVEIDSGNHSP